MKSKIIFVTGGQRSGKSSFAQRMAEQLSKHPIYLATARHWDADFEKRIQKHQADRGESWTTIEEEKYPSRHPLAHHTILLDCVTLWLTNLFCDNNFELQPTLAEAQAEWDRLIALEGMTLIVVSNEIGMGMHAMEESGRHFADLQGWMNQYIATRADEVYFTVSGIPIKIK